MSALVDELRAAAALTKPLVYTISVGSDGGFIEAVSLADYEAAVDALQSRLEIVEAERDEARLLVTEANNSLYGSQGYFHSLNGGPFDKYHLAKGIENLKDSARKRHRAEARVEELQKALATVKRAVSYPVSTEIKACGWAWYVAPDAPEFIVETIDGALSPARTEEGKQ